MDDTKRPERTATDALTIPDHQMLRRIGDGSYGEVWLARSATGALRAVKIVRRDAFDNDKPFEREFNGLLHFEPLSRGHEGLVDILQVGRSSSGDSFYCIMELADAALPQGEDGGSKMEDGSQGPPSNRHPPSSILDPRRYRPLTLDVLIRQRGGRLPVKECLTIASTMASALQYLHNAGLVHRDIKPSNIIFVGGVPKLADVGLVARTDSARTFVGTEGFLPPEGPGTPQADIYSLGKCLYEMAMGKDRQSFPSPPTMLDELPDRAELLELNEVITKACEPMAVHRYSSAARLQKDLQVLSAGRSLQRYRRQARFRRLGVAVGVLNGFALVSWLGLGWLQGPRLELVCPPFALPGGWGAGQARLGHFEGGSDIALFTASEVTGVLAVSSLSGQRRMHGGIQDFRGRRFLLDLLADTNGDQRDEVFASWMEGTNLFIGLFNQNLSLTHPPLRATAAMLETTTGADPDGLITAWAFLPAALERSPKLLASLGSGFSKGPRGIRFYDLTSGDLVWDRPFPSCPREVVAAPVLEGDSRMFVVGTFGQNNRLRDADGTDDEHTYLYALNEEGRRLWTVQTGEAPLCTAPVLAQSRNVNHIFAVVYLEPELYFLSRSNQIPPATSLLRVDSAGRPLAQYPSPTPLRSLAVADLDGDAALDVIATDGEGGLQLLDAELNPIRRICVVQRTHDWVDLVVSGIADLDGDGRPEVVLQSTQWEFVSGMNPGRMDGERNVRRDHEHRVTVLDSTLAPIVSRVVGISEGAKPTDFKVMLAPNYLSRRCNLVAVDDKVTVLRYQRR